MVSTAAAVVLTCMCTGNALAAPPPTRTEVKSLPGYGPPPSRMFAGFSSGGVPPSGVGEMFFHYVMYEAEDVDPADAPCLIWYNGGPGSPSAFGMFQELGPPPFRRRI